MLKLFTQPRSRRHEHLYTLIERNLVRSDDFVDDRLAMARQLLDSRIILCTLSMLTHERMSTIARIVPVQTIIFDEASQIEVGDYLPVIHRFASSLQKMVFIGDDKQRAFTVSFLNLPLSQSL